MLAWLHDGHLQGRMVHTYILIVLLVAIYNAETGPGNMPANLVDIGFLDVSVGVYVF